MACATVAHSPAELSFATALVANRTFDLARSGKLSIPAFPNFKKTVEELKSAKPPDHPDYSVTIPIGDSLVIKEALVEQWSGKPDYKAEMEKLVENHNSIFNKRGIKRGNEASSTSQSDRPTKKICAETDALGLDEFETKYPERLLG